MFCIYRCGLFVLDLIFDREKVLEEMNELSYEEKYYLLKGLASIIKVGFDGKKELKINKKVVMPKIKIKQCGNDFHSFGHHLSGANFHIFNYNDERVRVLVRQMKFNENYWVAKFFGYCLAKNMYDSKNRSRQIDSILTQGAYLVPIPVHWKRFLERGFNQTHWLCQEILKNLKKPELNFTHEIKYSKKLLKRIVYSQKQSWTVSEKRAENIKGVFKVGRYAKKIMRGSNIILIDDVFTTGSTINEASRVLMQAGAKMVISFTVAR